MITLNSFIDSCDICFIQEHWLSNALLHKIGEISQDFVCTSVSSMVDSSILSGRPFGGCSILYRRHLSLSVTPIYSCSNSFCAVKLTDSSGTSFSLICVYMPAESHSSSSGEYLNTLGEVEGFIDSLQCDNNIIVGDFNADFDRGGLSADLLSDFVLDLNVSVCDLHYRESVKCTYERDDGLVRSWIDHVLCSQAISILVTDIYTLQSGVNLSDHLPLFFTLHINHSSLSSLPATSSSKPICIDWSEITSSHIDNYQDMLCDRLSDPPAELLSCSLPNCSAHAIVCWMIILNILCPLCYTVLLTVFLVRDHLSKEFLVGRRVLVS